MQGRARLALQLPRAAHASAHPQHPRSNTDAEPLLCLLCPQQAAATLASPCPNAWHTQALGRWAGPSSTFFSLTPAARPAPSLPPAGREGKAKGHGPSPQPQQPQPAASGGAGKEEQGGAAAQQGAQAAAATVQAAHTQTGVATKWRPGQALQRFGRDLTAEAGRGLLDPVVGREPVIQRALQVPPQAMNSHSLLVWTLMPCFTVLHA
ncbi:hypothetical protein V8C86DRAFT_2483450 [Haematococcus lacustris]